MKCSVAAVIRRAGDGRILSVRRPLDDRHLPGLWGLPAVTLAPGELPEAAVRRIGREKLGVDIEPVRFVGIDNSDRGEYRLILMDIEAVLQAGEPELGAATTDATRYIDSRWIADLSTLVAAAERGSLCCRILLDTACENEQRVQ